MLVKYNERERERNREKKIFVKINKNLIKKLELIYIEDKM